MRHVARRTLCCFFRRSSLGGSVRQVDTTDDWSLTITSVVTQLCSSVNARFINQDFCNTATVDVRTGCEGTGQSVYASLVFITRHVCKPIVWVQRPMYGAQITDIVVRQVACDHIASRSA